MKRDISAVRLHRMGRGRRLAGVLSGAAVTGFVFLCAARGIAEDPADRSRARVSGAEVHGSGGWQARGGAAVQRWQLDVRRGAGTAIGGRLAIGGSALFSTGNVEGSLDGTRINGTVVADDGRLLATFSGTVSPSGAAGGTYLDVSGETGEWATEGTPLSGVAIAVDPVPPPAPDTGMVRPPDGVAADTMASVVAVRARVAALAAMPHPRDPRRHTLVVLPEEPDAPPRFDSGVPDPDRIEPPARPPRPAIRRPR